MVGRTRSIVLFTVLVALATTPARFAEAQDDHEAPPALFNWLDRINAVRAAANLPPIVEDADWSAGSTLHSRYMVKNDYLGHDEDEDNPWYSAEGREAAQNGIAYTNDRYDASEQRGIDALLTTPFHLISVLDPRLTKTGFGWYRESKDSFQAGVTLDVGRGLSASSDAPVYPILFPGAGKTMPFSRYYGTERPDPLTSCPGGDFVGAPLVAQLESPPQDVAVTLEKAGAERARCVFDETSYTHPDPDTQAAGRAILAARHAVVIMPRDPLSAGTYRVRLTSDRITYAWSFHGPAAAAPPESTVAQVAEPRSQVAAMSSATAPVLSVDCSPRPAVGLGVKPLDVDLVQLTVAAQGEHNTLRALRFGTSARPLQNASVMLPGHPLPITGRAVVTLPPGSPQRSFIVRRVLSGQATRATITVTDGCGDWPVLVRGEPDTRLTAQPELADSR